MELKDLADEGSKVILALEIVKSVHDQPDLPQETILNKGCGTVWLLRLTKP